jgi:hypothetical protein
MTDKPIIFSGPMVRALIDGRKTQTRRVLKPQPRENVFWGPEWYAPVKIDNHGEEYPGADVFGIYGEEWGQRIPYAPGDRLWVREAWKSDRAYDDLAPSEMGGDEPLIYVADNEVQRWGWKPDVLSRWGRYRHARFMPRWASRLTLTVTDVRVQRLQEISDHDAWAEGVNPCEEGHACPGGPYGSCCGHFDYIGPFRTLWNSLHGPDAWSANPWVAAVTFTVERRNIDKARP